MTTSTERTAIHLYVPGYRMGRIARIADLNAFLSGATALETITQRAYSSFVNLEQSSIQKPQQSGIGEDMQMAREVFSAMHEIRMGKRKHIIANRNVLARALEREIDEFASVIDERPVLAEDQITLITSRLPDVIHDVGNDIAGASGFTQVYLRNPARAPADLKKALSRARRISAASTSVLLGEYPKTTTEMSELLEIIDDFYNLDAVDSFDVNLLSVRLNISDQFLARLMSNLRQNSRRYDLAGTTGFRLERAPSSIIMTVRAKVPLNGKGFPLIIEEEGPRKGLSGTDGEGRGLYNIKADLAKIGGTANYENIRRDGETIGTLQTYTLPTSDAREILTHDAA